MTLATAFTIHLFSINKAMRTAITRLNTLSIVLALLSLSACGGGGGSQDSVRIGSGQNAASDSVSGADFPILYVKRTTPNIQTAMNNNIDDVRRLRVFNTNADLYIRDRASPSAAERNITARVHPANQRWDIKDLDVSADATKVIFAMRGPLTDNQKDKDPPNWAIWEYIIASDTLHRVITDNVIAAEGQDVSPHYLPDGHIIFSSTRQKASKAILIQDEQRTGFEAQDENRDESAFVLHVMDATGGNIQQVTFNQSHDTDATVLTDGRVLFSRWDHAPGRSGSGAGGVHFYTANPDGTDTQLLYGSASHNTIADTDANGAVTFPTVQFTKAREMRDGRILTLVRPFNDTEFGGDLYIIDTKNYVENNQVVVTANTANGATAKATPANVRLVNAPSIGGRFVAAAPLWDGTDRILASWTQCRVIDPTTAAIVNCTNSRLADPAFLPAPPVYSVWMFNPNDGTQQPVVTPVEGVMISEVVVAQPRTPAPTFRPVTLDANLTLNQTLKNQGVGVLDIRSVYDFDGVVGGGITSIAAVADPTSPGYANRPARFLRIEKAVSLPDRDVRDIDNSAFGATNFMREILGYVPIEPDGSVLVKVPGNVAFQISVTDSEGRRVAAFPRHNAWLSIRPGETVQCMGCHANSTNVPAGQSGRSHGRNGSFNSVYGGATAAGIAYSGANLTFTAGAVGNTMAQTRGAWSCANEQCASITPSVNVNFANVWPLGADPKVTPAAARTGDFALRYTGTGGLTTKVPVVDNSCYTIVWKNTCRITINYLEHIQPIWERPLGFDANNDMVVDAKDTCISCHSRTDAANATQIPAGQLELTSDASDQNGAGIRVTSYQELLFGDIALALVNNVLQDHCLQFVTDPVTMVQTCAVFENVSPSLIARNARGSRFFSKFTSTGTHATAGVPWLTPGELKLISEWVDIGAQYYNDPFKAPEN